MENPGYPVPPQTCRAGERIYNVRSSTLAGVTNSDGADEHIVRGAQPLPAATPVLARESRSATRLPVLTEV
jgi:hypothetical protein